MNRPILVCFAIKEEAKFFKPVPGTDVRVLLTGMSARNAERAVRAAVAIRLPQLVVTSGFAGGLAPDLGTGAVIFTGDLDSPLEQKLLSAGARRGRFHCADRVATTAPEKRRLRETTGADAVEMESGVICDVCQSQGILSATVRVILDSVDENLPLDFNRLMTADQALDPRKLAQALLSSPLKIRALLRLRRQSDAAAKSLATALTRMLSK